MTQVLAAIRTLPPRTLAAIVASNAVLLALTIAAGLPYVVVLVMLALELVVLQIATIGFYRERGLGRHFLDLAKMLGGLVFILFFGIVTFGIAAEGGNGQALATGFAGFASADTTALVAGAAWIVGQAIWSLMEARRQPDPQRAWTESTLKEAAVTFLAIVFVVFAAGIAGRPLVAAFSTLDPRITADHVVATLLVLVRLFFALVAASMPAPVNAEIARNPYVDG